MLNTKKENKLLWSADKARKKNSNIKNFADKISQKYKITINDLLSFNPELRDSRLRRRSTILVPIFKSSEDLNLKVVENEFDRNRINLSRLYLHSKEKKK